MEGRARTLPAPVFIDLAGRGRMRRITMASAAGVALEGANALEQADRQLTIARQRFPRDSTVYHEAAAVAEREQRPVAAAALRDSARIARTIPYASTSFASWRTRSSGP